MDQYERSNESVAYSTLGQVNRTVPLPPKLQPRGQRTQYDMQSMQMYNPRATIKAQLTQLKLMKK